MLTFEHNLFVLIYFIFYSVFQFSSFCNLKREIFLTDTNAFECAFQLNKSKYEQTNFFPTQQLSTLANIWHVCLFVCSSIHLLCILYIYTFVRTIYWSNCQRWCDWSIDEPQGRCRGWHQFSLRVQTHLHNNQIILFCLYNYFVSQTNIFPLSLQPF